MNKVLQTIWVSLATTCLVVTMFVLFYHVFSMPEVHWSQTGNKCVKVFSNNNKLNCTNIHDVRYKRIWVR